MIYMKSKEKIVGLAPFEEAIGVLHELQEIDGSCLAGIGPLCVSLPEYMASRLRESQGRKIGVLRTDRDYRFRVSDQRGVLEMIAADAKASCNFYPCAFKSGESGLPIIPNCRGDYCSSQAFFERFCHYCPAPHSALCWPRQMLEQTGASISRYIYNLLNENKEFNGQIRKLQREARKAAERNVAVGSVV
jgi:hypothetical protein